MLTSEATSLRGNLGAPTRVSTAPLVARQRAQFFQMRLYYGVCLPDTFKRTSPLVTRPASCNITVDKYRIPQ